MKRDLNLRFLNAIAWGIVAFAFVVSGLWSFTLMDIFGIIFVAILAYLFVIGIVMLVTEPKKKKPEPKPLNPADCPIYTLRKEDWE